MECFNIGILRILVMILSLLQFNENQKVSPLSTFTIPLLYIKLNYWLSEYNFVALRFNKGVRRCLDIENE